jgi:murein DD-endopeptidase MepM/ murein hydrolase activator NlpD
MAITLQADEETLNNIIKKSSIGFKPKEKTEVLTEKSVVKVSNTITSLQNAFNRIYTYTLNVKNIHKIEERRLQNIKKEVTMETKTSSASLAGGAAVDIGIIPDLFKQLTKTVEELTDQLNKLDMGPCVCDTGDITGGADVDDDDFDRRRRRRTRGRGRGRGRGSRPRPRPRPRAPGTRIPGRGRIGFGGRFLIGLGIDSALGLFGVGQGLDDEALTAQDEENWNRATTLEKIQSSIPRGIEHIGNLFGLSNLSAQARADRIKDETEYLQRTRPASRGSERQLERTTSTVAQQQARLEKGTSPGTTSFSSRFADYLNQSISNMATWAMSASPMLAAFMAAGAGVMRLFSPGDYTLSGDTRADFQSIMDMAAAAGAPHPEIVAAQWALESGWGRSMSGRNNPFGQKATDNEPGTARRTREVINGQSVYITARFKDYASLDEAIAEHVRRWNTRYTTAGTTPLEAIQAIAARGYATDPNYVASISRILAGQNIDPRQPFTYRAAASGTVIRSGTTARRLSGVFGERREGHLHAGIDIPGTVGEPIASLQAGSVIFAGMGTPGSGYNDYGNVVHVRQDNGYEALYAHLHRISPGVRQGTRVLAAQIIGELGSTGRSSGPHLHFEIRRGNAKYDPTALYNSNPWIVGGRAATYGATINRSATEAAIASLLGDFGGTRAPSTLTNLQQSPSSFFPSSPPAAAAPGSGWFGRDAWRRAQTRR